MRKFSRLILMMLVIGGFLVVSPQIANAKNGTTPTALRGSWYHNTKVHREVMIIKPHLIVYEIYKKHTNHKVKPNTYIGRAHLYSKYVGKGYWQIGLKESDAVSSLKPIKYHGKKVLYQHLGYFGYGHQHILWHRY